MQEPSIPNNEEQRLKALYELELMDTDSDENLDRLTRTTKLIFEASMVLISFIDRNRQWFKSKDGFNLSEVPRNTSFCAHTILQDKLFVIPDIQKDKRFYDHPLTLKNPKVRFYAGYPISTPGNLNVGTLCMFDKKPRQLHEREAEIFQNLALTVEYQINSLKFITIDDLTSTLNYRGFIKSANKQLNVCKELNLNAILTLIRLDNLESINYDLNSNEIDQTIIDFTNLLKQYLNESDILSKISRNEFAIFSSGKNNEIIRYIITNLQRKLQEYDHKRQIKLSYQIVQLNPKQHNNIDELLSSARELM